MGFCHRLLFTAYMTAGKFTSCYNAVKAQSHYDAGGAPVRDQASTGLNRGPYRDEPVLHRDEPWTTGDNRGSTGLVLTCLIPPG